MAVAYKSFNPLVPDAGPEFLKIIANDIEERELKQLFLEQVLPCLPAMST